MSEKRYCDCCDKFIRNFTSAWNRHLRTDRHQRCSENKITNLENEEWKKFPENERYQISNKGRVKCFENLPKVALDKDGYRTFQCKIDGKHYVKRIGRLVAIMFIPNPHNYPVVDHIDRNRENDDVTNLRWVTYQTSAINRGLQSNNKTGYTGVSLTKDNKYYAYIKYNYKVYNLGCYDNLEAALQARKCGELYLFNFRNW